MTSNHELDYIPRSTTKSGRPIMHCYWESGYAPWIDVLLVFHARGGNNGTQTLHEDAPSNVITQAIPRDIALYTAGIYIKLITPLIACRNFRMYMYAEGNIFKWRADAEVINSCAIDPGSSRVLRVKPIGHLKCMGMIDHVTKIVSGCEFGIGITADGYFGWGTNSSGQLGLVDRERRKRPTWRSLPEFIDWIVHNDDKSPGAHLDSSRPPGDGSLGPRPPGDGVPLDENTSCIVDVACGDTHTMLLVFDAMGRSAAFGFGSNQWGQLGIVRDHQYFTNPRMVNVSNPSAIACGDDYSLILAQGRIYLCANFIKREIPFGCAFTDGVFAGEDADDIFANYTQDALTDKLAEIGVRTATMLDFFGVYRIHVCCRSYTIWSESKRTVCCAPVTIESSAVAACEWNETYRVPELQWPLTCKAGLIPDNLAAGTFDVSAHTTEPADSSRPSNSLRGQIISVVNGASFIMFTTTYGLFVWHNQKYTLLYKL